MHSYRGRKRLQDGRLQVEEEVSRGTVFRLEDSRDIPHAISAYDVARKVANYVQMDINILLGYSRSKSLVKWRHLTYLLAAELTGASTPELGERFNRDHTSIMHGKKNATALLTDPIFNEHYKTIKALF